MDELPRAASPISLVGLIEGAPLERPPSMSLTVVSTPSQQDVLDNANLTSGEQSASSLPAISSDALHREPAGSVLGKRGRSSRSPTPPVEREGSLVRAGQPEDGMSFCFATGRLLCLSNAMHISYGD